MIVLVLIKITPASDDAIKKLWAIFRNFLENNNFASKIDNEIDNDPNNTLYDNLFSNFFLFTLIKFKIT